MRRDKTQSNCQHLSEHRTKKQVTYGRHFANVVTLSQIWPDFVNENISGTKVRNSCRSPNMLQNEDLPANRLQCSREQALQRSSYIFSSDTFWRNLNYKYNLLSSFFHGLVKPHLLYAVADRQWLSRARLRGAFLARTFATELWTKITEHQWISKQARMCWRIASTPVHTSMPSSNNCFQGAPKSRTSGL